MVMRIGGLASGMDIDELVKKLMMAERAPLDKLFQKKTTYEWQRDAYRSVNTKLKTFDTYVADNLSLKTMNSKTASSSNSSLVSAVATGKASGTLTIEGVSQLAKAARSVGDQINATGSTKMSTIATGPIEFRAINKNGEMPVEPTIINITDDMTVDDFVKKVNESNAGVSAVFENGRFSFTAKNTGKGEIDIKENGIDGMKLKSESGQNAIFQVNGIATERASNSFSMNGYNVTLKDTFNTGGTMNEMLSLSFTERKNAAADLPIKKATYEANKLKYEEALKKYNNAFSGSLTSDQKDGYGKISLETRPLLAGLDYNQAKELAAKIDFTNETTVKDSIANLPEGSFSQELKESLGTVPIDNLKEITELVKDPSLTEVNYNAYSKVSKLERTFASLDKGELKNISDLAGQDIKDALANIDLSAPDPFANLADGAVKDKLKTLSMETLVTLKDLDGAEIDTLTGATVAQGELTKAHNEFKVADEENKAAIARDKKAESNYKQLYKDNIFKGKEEDFEDAYENHIADPDAKAPTVPGDTTTVGPVTLTSTTNVDDMMKTITDFVDTYNGLIKDLKNQTSETKYRDYKPLTDEQKKDMSENEIKLWEEKAKSGLLRSDALIRNGLADMRSLVYQTNPGLSESKFNSLFSIGITTSKNYNEGGTLEIDTEKLRKAIEEDPDAVEKLFKNSDGKKDGMAPKIGTDGKPVLKADGTPEMEPADTRGYVDKLRESIKSFEISIEKKAGRSTMTDAQYSIGMSLQDTDKRIKTWERKLEMTEARYWKQFGAMEAAINKANQQAGMFMQGQ